MIIIIETPKGSPIKYRYDEQKQQFVAHKQLPDGMAFPVNFGFIPQTNGDDGDPLDVIVLAGTTYATGREVECRIIGCLPAQQTFEETTIRNDRFVAVSLGSATYRDVQSISELDASLIAELESFFITYLAAEGKTVVFLESLNHAEASHLIEEARL